MRLTIPAAVARAAQEFGDATALAEPGGPRLTHVDMHERVRTVARALIAEGIRPGDRVAVWSANTHHWVLAALGSSYAGATIVPVNTRFAPPEALDVIRRSDAQVLFVAGRFLGVDRFAALRAAADDEGAPLPRLVVRLPVESEPPGGGDDGVLAWDALGSCAAAVPAPEADARAGAADPDDVSDILFTSGTTGRSKGAMSAHRQSLAVATAWAEIGGLTRADRYLVINPFFHSFGFKAGILACLVSGATLVPQSVFDVEQAMRVIQDERITVLPGPPTIYQSMLDHPAREKYDLSSLRLAVTGAATVPAVLVERMRDELGFTSVLTAYGLTEAVVATMCRPGDDPQTVAYTSGRAAAGFEIRIAGPATAPGEAAATAPGEPGEILLRGPNLMLGYLDDPAATAAAIDPDGWLHTGDVGRLDERGYLRITDRLKDMYICGGFNVYPAEVEQVLTRLPEVAEAAVIGLPDPRLGEVGKAYVVTRPGRALSTEDVLAYCRARLANYKVPRQVEFRTDLPRNASGKTLKHVLRAESTRGAGMSEEAVVTYERQGPVAVVTMNRPRYRNAQNSAMTYALDAAFSRAVDDDEVAVIVLAGAGEHFSAGHDIGTPGRDVDISFDRRAVLWWDHVGRSGADLRYARETEVYLGMCRRWREMPKPSIAMVQGACVAGGLMLAWVCDLIIAADDAFFADPVLRMGIPGVEYFAHPWMLGPRFAKEVLFTGDRFDARRAYEMGMVNRVVPRAELAVATLALAGRIAAMPRFGLALAKRAVNQCEDLMGMRPAMDAVFGLHHLAHSHNAEVSGDALAGMDARAMKRAEP